VAAGSRVRALHFEGYVDQDVMYYNMKSIILEEKIAQTVLESEEHRE
jgi:hypothetical protein